MGFDPTLGLMHADKRYRPSLASDLMEPVRLVADRIVVELLRDREFSRGDVVETGRESAGWGPDWRGNWDSTHTPCGRQSVHMRSGWHGSC